METILIDTFLVPATAKDAFVARARQMQSFIKTLPGFVEGFMYEQRESVSQQQILTIAVWEDAEAFEQAKQAVAKANQEQGINPQEVTRQLGITFTRAMYQRDPY